MSHLDLSAENDGIEAISVDTEEEHQLALDLVEWWCHLLMQDGASAEVVEKRGQDLHRALVHMGGEIHSYGRLYNRLQVSALVLDVCARRTCSSSESGGEEGPEALSDWTADQWNMIREQLILLKSLLLRHDANVLVLPYGQKDQKLPPRNDQLDQDAGALDIFSGEEYKTVVSLLQVHETVARFRAALQGLVKDSHRRQNKTSTKSHSVLLKKLEIIIDEYEGDLAKLLSSSAAAATTSSEKENDKDSGDTNKLQAALTSFLLPDLYRSQSDSVHSLPKRLLQDLSTLMAAQSGEEEEVEYSYRTLQTKLQSLLKRWCDQVLTKPTLVRLGYGTKKTYDDDEEDRCSVSSWGATQQSSDERDDHMDMEPVSLQQQQSQSPPLHSVPATGTKTAATEMHVVTWDSGPDDEKKLAAVETASPVPEEEEDTGMELGTQPPVPPEEPESPASMPTERNREEKSQPVREEEEDTGMELGTQPPVPPEEPRPPASVPTERNQEEKSQPVREEEEDTGMELGTQPPVPPEEPKTPATAPTERKQEDRSQPTKEAAFQKESAARVTVSPSSSSPVRESRSAASMEVVAAAVGDDDDENITDPQSQRTPPPVQSSKKRNGQRNGGASRKRTAFADLWPSSSDDEEAAPPRRHSWTAKRTSPQPKRPLHSSSPRGKKKKRRFTEDEKQAIIAGVRRYGKGSWKEIKDGSKGVLQSRTTVNIKDCYRTMVKRGEITG